MEQAQLQCIATLDPTRDELEIGDYATPGKGCVFVSKLLLHAYSRKPILVVRPRSSHKFHTRRPRKAHANADTPNAYPPNTHIARTFEAYIVRIDRFTTPVATFARRKTAREFRLIASSKGGAGIGLGSESGIVSGVDAESETLSSSSLGRRTTLRPETGEYVLLESGVGKKARSRSK